MFVRVFSLWKKEEKNAKIEKNERKKEKKILKFFFFFEKKSEATQKYETFILETY